MVARAQSLALRNRLPFDREAELFPAAAAAPWPPPPPPPPPPRCLTVSLSAGILSTSCGWKHRDGVCGPSVRRPSHLLHSLPSPPRPPDLRECFSRSPLSSAPVLVWCLHKSLCLSLGLPVSPKQTDKQTNRQIHKQTNKQTHAMRKQEEQLVVPEDPKHK